MDYCLITSEKSSFYEATKTIEDEVKAKCKQGWIPQGGISLCVHVINDFHTYYTMSQTMIKPDGKDKSDLLKSYV